MKETINVTMKVLNSYQLIYLRKGYRYEEKSFVCDFVRCDIIQNNLDKTKN